MKQMNDCTGFPALTYEVRRQAGQVAEKEGQAAAMAALPFFDQVRLSCPAGRPEVGQASPEFTAAVFNVERGQRLDEILAWNRETGILSSFDFILANELDDGCLRSGNRDVSACLAEELDSHEVFGLEFLELTCPDNEKGYHGNSIFSKWPVKRAKLVRLPEVHDWYWDAKQSRVGGRQALLAEVEVSGRPLGLITVHLENRTGSAGRGRQIKALLDEVGAFFTADTPVVLGGDFNTNGYDGADGQAMRDMYARPAAERVTYARGEAMFDQLVQAGFALPPGAAGESLPLPTRRARFREDLYVDDEEVFLDLYLDWIFTRGLTHLDYGTVDTRIALAGRTVELSDHNLVWGRYSL